MFAPITADRIFSVLFRIIRTRKEFICGQLGGTATSRTEEPVASCVARGGRHWRRCERGKHETTQILFAVVAGP